MASFTVPAGWQQTTVGPISALQPPETDLTLLVVEDVAGHDGVAAAAGAWQASRPTTLRPVHLVTEAPPRNGWDERLIVDYETSPNERAHAQAFAHRRGGAWTVLIVDGSEATFEKRMGPITIVLESLRPDGYLRESFAGRTAHALDDARIAAMTAFVQQSIDALGIPGAAMALVDRSGVRFAGGFGVRELGKPERVDGDTLFMIASNTKGMTTLLLALLVDRGAIAWEQPVTDAFPAFRLGSDEVTRSVRMKHLVSAATGLPRQDFEWIFTFRGDTPASATFDLLRTSLPTSGFGEVYQYNNLMAAAAGYIGGRLAHPEIADVGAAYDAAMRESIFDPLGMPRTTFDMDAALGGNHAAPHGDDLFGRPSVAAMDFNYAGVAARPSGGAWSSARELIEYVRLELATGLLPDGTRLVSEENLLARRVPGVAMGDDRWYGMGLCIDRFWGTPVIHHGGSMLGFKSNVYILPEAGIGAVLLTNSENGQSLLRPFRRRLLEVLYEGRPEAVEDVAAAAAANAATLATFRAETVLPADATGLADRYESPELGHIDVLRDADDVVFDFGLWRSRVGTRANDDGTTSFVTTDPGSIDIPFVAGERTGRRALILRDSQHEYVYVAS
jgi:CubicO group peptidase (beta-lactamase class C family)